MKIIIGCDEAAVRLKACLAGMLRDMGFECDCAGAEDENAPVSYPDVAFEVAHAIKDGKYDRGILVCGTGIGMAMAANKVKGIRAAQCHDTYSAQRAALSNNAHIITLGAKVVGLELAKEIVRTWLSLEFKDGRSSQKIKSITDYELKM